MLDVDVDVCRIFCFQAGRGEGARWYNVQYGMCLNLFFSLPYQPPQPRGNLVREVQGGGRQRACGVQYMKRTRYKEREIRSLAALVRVNQKKLGWASSEHIVYRLSTSRTPYSFPPTSDMCPIMGSGLPGGRLNSQLEISLASACSSSIINLHLHRREQRLRSPY